MFFLSNIGGVVTVLKNMPGKKNDSFKKKRKKEKKNRLDINLSRRVNPLFSKRG